MCYINKELFFTMKTALHAALTVTLLSGCLAMAEEANNAEKPEYCIIKREDGRTTGSLTAFLTKVRNTTPNLAFKAKTQEELIEWQAKVRVKLTQLLRMPEITPQPQPKRLSVSQREGYRLEKWEFYPYDYCAVPVLILIPDNASAENKVPGVLCFPGSSVSKEVLAGEPFIDHPNCKDGRFLDRNRMAWHYVKAGYAAVAFDNPATAECSELDLPSPKHGATRVHYCSMLLEAGYTYMGMSVFQAMRFLDYFKNMDFVDSSRIAVSGHSLGSEPALCLGILRSDVMAVVFNDFLCDNCRRYQACTGNDPRFWNSWGNWHWVPGIWREFAYPDMVAALAPKYLAMNEGGADEFTNTVFSAYRLAGAEDHVQLTYYPYFSDPAKRKNQNSIVPNHGLTEEQFFMDYSYVYASDHSFRSEPSLKLLKKAFGK